MGHAYADIELSNPRRPDLDSMKARALADTGSMMLCIPRHVAMQLHLEAAYEREVTLADGSKQMVPYVGPIHLKFGKRGCFVGAFVIGDEVLLGAVPMEDMDLVISPSGRSVTVNPESPNIPHGKVKACSRVSGGAFARA